MTCKKNRNYKKGEPFRDSKFVIIATEGAKREKEYFETLCYGNQRVKIIILAPTDEEQGKSAPKWVLERAVNYVEKFGLNEDDQMWMVIDVDRWSTAHIHEIAKESETLKNWHIAVSNPCFEIWLLLHYKEVDKKQVKSCGDLKFELGKTIKGGYKHKIAIDNIHTAIQRAESSDSNKGHYYPNEMESKVYLLAKVLTSL